MVNYRRVVCEVAVLAALVVATLAAPAPDCEHGTHYDQRQNGSDNVRVHVDGVVVAVMPAESLAESLLSALPDLSELLEEDDLDILKPKPPQSEVQSPSISPVAPPKPEEKPQASPDKEEAPESAPVKPTEIPTSEAVSTPQATKNQKKEQYLKQRKAQRYYKSEELFGKLPDTAPEKKPPPLKNYVTKFEKEGADSGATQ